MNEYIKHIKEHDKKIKALQKLYVIARDQETKNWARFLLVLFGGKP